MIGDLLLQVMFVITREVNPTLEYNNHLIIVAVGMEIVT